MTQGERLKFVISRVAYNNQALFARTCGVPAASVTRLISGEYKMSPTYAMKFCKAYPGVNPDYLMGVSDFPGTFLSVETLEKEVQELREENKRLKMVIDRLLGNQ